MRRSSLLLSVLSVVSLCPGLVSAQEPATAAADAVYEIRNYHFDPALIGEYEVWARDRALPYIRKHLDVVGFWIDRGIAPEIDGAPLDELGSANVTWIVRWNSKAERDATWAKAFSGPEWDAIFAEVPGGPPSYKRVEAKFFKGI